jgi:hypothetical protein
MYFSGKIYGIASLLKHYLLLLHPMFDFPFGSPGTSVAVSSILLALIMAGRAAFVFPLSLLINLVKKYPNEKISFRQQVWILFL